MDLKRAVSMYHEDMLNKKPVADLEPRHGDRSDDVSYEADIQSTRTND